jgi:DNA/RNA-binding domain of Phe-tRNA-synthetase-like protein
LTAFQYHPDIFAKYPNVVGGVILTAGLTNGPSPNALVAAFHEEQQATLARIGETPLSEIPSLAAWRSAFRSFGVEPTQYRSAAEALLRRLTKKGDIPTINTLVDLGNLVSIRYALPVAVIDTRAIHGAITVHFADGTEPFTNLDRTEVDYPAPGEVIFSDENRQVVARRWCWRQSEQSAARHDTTDVIITVEAHHAGGQADVQAALDDLSRLLAQYTGGQATSALLDRDRPGI